MCVFMCVEHVYTGMYVEVCVVCVHVGAVYARVCACVCGACTYRCVHGDVRVVGVCWRVGAV